MGLETGPLAGEADAHVTAAAIVVQAAQVQSRHSDHAVPFSKVEDNDVAAQVVARRHHRRVMGHLNGRYHPKVVAELAVYAAQTPFPCYQGIEGRSPHRTQRSRT